MEHITGEYEKSEHGEHATGEHETYVSLRRESGNQKNVLVIGLSFVIAGMFIAGAWVYTGSAQFNGRGNQNQVAIIRDNNPDAILEESVIPKEGYILPITWGNLGKRMVEAGVIDAEKLKQVYAERGGLTPEEEQMLLSDSTQPIRITKDNSGFILNMLWAYGLAQTSPILERGEMTAVEYGGNAGQFASTGGWTLARGKAMDHYSKHAFVMLTVEQQALVDRVSRNIYRPCCGNSTHFPDCNHGMAMLGLLELMAANNVSEADMYKAALQVNAYWFPDTYLTIAKYFKAKGVEWSAVDPRIALSNQYSSAAGFSKVLSAVEPVNRRSAGGCGI